MPPRPAPMDPIQITESLTLNYSDSVLETLADLADPFLISDPSLSGHPIVFASQTFLSMSGYSKQEVVGRNGRMFQGPRTDRRSVMEIREAIREERSVEISLWNYKKDGLGHWVWFHLCPVVFEGRVVHFLAVVLPIGRGLKARRVVFGFGGCREEELACRGESLTVDSFEDTDNRGLEAEELHEASDLEKQKATNTVKSILSILNYYRKHTNRVGCGKICSSTSIVPLTSSLKISLGRIKQSFVLTDPNVPDMPIVYASDTFLNLTGYSRHEVLGRNCRFLDGPGTDVEAVQEIKDSIQGQQACKVRMLNYRKDGSSFWNLLHVSPVRNATGKIAYYVWVQMNENGKDVHGLSAEMRQMGAVGAVKVAVRSLSAGPGPSSGSSLS